MRLLQDVFKALGYLDVGELERIIRHASEMQGLCKIIVRDDVIILDCPWEVDADE